MKQGSTQKYVTVALLTALQVIFSKFLMMQLAPSVRISIDSVPILLSGIWFGPIWGGAVGLLGDLIGTILFPTAGAYYPPLTAAFILTGVLSGLIAKVSRPTTIFRCAAVVVPSETLSNLFLKSFLLSRLYGISFRVVFPGRIIPVLICMLLDTGIVYTLIRLLKNRSPEHPVQTTYSEYSKGITATQMTYDEALTYIHSITWRSSRLGLDRTRELLSLLGNPERKLKFIHVAGTNGKGSTCSMLASVLHESGYKVGLYISPFVDRFNERMQIDFCPISDEDLARITSIVRQYADGMEDHPTEFEMITAIAVLYFFENNCDIVVLEVGMGGELDSTNVIPVPELAVITRIGLDHTRELGPDIRSIAAAKAGIIKAGGTVVTYGDDRDAEEVFAQKCQSVHADLVLTDHSRIRNIRSTETSLVFDFIPFQDLELSLIASCQPHNAAVVLTSLEVLRAKGWIIPESAIRKGLSSVHFSARFELLSSSPVFLADGSHNPQGIETAVESLKMHYPERPVIFLLGVLRDKDIDGILSLLIPASDSFVTVTPDSPRAMPAEELAQKIRSLGKTAVSASSVEDGIDIAVKSAGTRCIICSLGSLYYMGKVRKYWGK